MIDVNFMGKGIGVPGDKYEYSNTYLKCMKAKVQNTRGKHKP